MQLSSCFSPTDLVSKGAPTSTAPAVVLTALAVARLAVEVAMRLMPHYKMWSAIRNDLISIALSWSLLRFGSQNQPEPRIIDVMCANLLGLGSLANPRA